MQTDAIKLGFDFAKEIAIQLITLATGLLALSVTFTKDILKGIPKGQEKTLKRAWGILVFSIFFGIGAISALTGVLMPGNGQRANPLQFTGTVRIFAGAQLGAFLLGTSLLVWVYGNAAISRTVDEYRLFRIAGDELTTTLNDLVSQGWEIVTITVRDDNTAVSLMKRAGSSTSLPKPGQEPPAIGSATTTI